MIARRVVVGLLMIVAILLVAIFMGMAIFRERFFDLYTRRLDSWVADGGHVDLIQSRVVENCGKLVLTQAGALAWISQTRGSLSG